MGPDLMTAPHPSSWAFIRTEDPIAWFSRDVAEATPPAWTHINRFQHLDRAFHYPYAACLFTLRNTSRHARTAEIANRVAAPRLSCLDGSRRRVEGAQSLTLRVHGLDQRAARERVAVLCCRPHDVGRSAAHRGVVRARARQRRPSAHADLRQWPASGTERLPRDRARRAQGSLTPALDCARAVCSARGRPRY